MQQFHFSHFRIFRHMLTGTTLLLALFAAFNASAAFAQTDISKGYITDDTLVIGSLVSLKTDSTDRVVAASTNSSDALLGVVINTGTSSIAVSSGDANEVQIATSGSLPVLVTDLNGDISPGDHITASPIAGVGMKATNNARIIGVAQGSIAPTSATKQAYQTGDGEQKTALIGQVPIIVNVSYYFKEPEKTIIPSTLQSLANALAGREVSTLPIVISAAIFIVTIIVVSSIIYSMIRNSIISVGRNPLSQSAIYRDLIQLSALVLVILAVAVAAIYFVLTRL